MSSENNPTPAQEAEIKITNDYFEVINKNIENANITETPETFHLPKHEEAHKQKVDTIKSYLRGWKLDSLGQKDMNTVNRCEVFRRGTWVLIPTIYCKSCDQAFGLQDYNLLNFDRIYQYCSDDPDITAVKCPQCKQFTNNMNLNCSGYVPIDETKSSQHIHYSTDIKPLLSVLDMKQIVTEQIILLGPKQIKARFNKLAMNSTLKTLTVFELVKQQPTLAYNLLIKYETVLMGITELLKKTMHLLKRAEEELMCVPPEEVYGQDDGVRLKPESITNPDRSGIEEMFKDLNIKQKFQPKMIVKYKGIVYSLGKLNGETWTALDVLEHGLSEIPDDKLEAFDKESIYYCDKHDQPFQRLICERTAYGGFYIEKYQCKQCESCIVLVV